MHGGGRRGGAPLSSFQDHAMIAVSEPYHELVVGVRDRTRKEKER